MNATLLVADWRAHAFEPPQDTVTFTRLAVPHLAGTRRRTAKRPWRARAPAREVERPQTALAVTRLGELPSVWLTDSRHPPDNELAER